MNGAASKQLVIWKERFDRIGEDISSLYRSNLIWADFREPRRHLDTQTLRGLPTTGYNGYAPW